MTPLPHLPASPAPSTAVTAAPPGSAPPISLPAPPSPPPAVAPASGAPDRVLLVLVAGLAFLLASFPARNSDVWRHLATGRLLAHGDFAFAADPGPVPVFRGNPAWLYDLLCYAVHAAVGGAGLVAFKALLVAALGVVLLLLSRAGRGWVLAAGCTALALLAMSTRLPLRPATVSYLFLGLALWFVRDRERGAGPWPPPWPLVLLFVLWANMDGWFVVGLATVALVWLGRVLDEATSGDGPRRGAWPGLLRCAGGLAVLAAVCLVNPSLAEAFKLPKELASVVDPASAAAATGADQVTSPFQAAYFRAFGRTAAGLAYFPLLGLSLLSFGLNLPRTAWRRFLPWLGLALLSAVQVRAVPFFAVVAGPVLAWNLHSWLAARPDRGAEAAGAWRGPAVAVVLVLLVCAWAGWLQVPPFEPRRWAVEPPRSLDLAARAVHRWHEEGKLAGASHGLHMAEDTANAFAWFCPEDPGVEDAKLTAAIRRELEVVSYDGPQHMRQQGIDHVIVYDSDPGRFFATLNLLLPYSREWPLLYLEGDVAIFGWRDPALAAEVDPFRDGRLDLHQLAFRPEKDKRAPREGPGREPEPRPWWQALYRPVPPRSPGQREATLYLTYAEAMRREAPRRHMALWDLSQGVATVGAAGRWGAAGMTAPAAVLLDAQLYLARIDPPVPEPGAGGRVLAAPARAVEDWQRRFVLQQDDAPPALLYLAVRAARRALEANPDDVQAYLDLGESYMRLMRSTRERAWGLRLDDLTQLRAVQASAALNRALVLRPDLARAHLTLSELYRGLNYLDLALEHFRKYVQLTRQEAPHDPAEAKAFNERLAGYEAELNRLAKEVEDRENTYAVAAAQGGLVLDRARLASQKGLARKALDLLLESDVSAFGAEGMKLELRLLLTTGQSWKVRQGQWVVADDKSRLGAPQFHWLQVMALAADGDYEKVQNEFDQLTLALLQDMRLANEKSLREAVGVLVGQAVLEERPGEGPVANLVRRAQGRVNMFKMLPLLSRQLTQQADMNVLRGLLSLEEGRVSEAKLAFEDALQTWRDEATVASGAGVDFGGRPIAQDCLEWLK